MWEKAHDMLKSMGYVDFNIDCTDEISFDNALRTLVNALGYKQIAYMYGEAMIMRIYKLPQIMI